MRDLDNAADLKWRLILSDDPAEITRLEAMLDGTRDEAVDEFIETSCWGDDLPHLVGNHGTKQRRLEALRGIWHATEETWNPPSSE